MKQFWMMNLLLCVFSLSAISGCNGISKKASAEAGGIDECSSVGIAEFAVVTFFNEDGSSYLTEQEHRICPGRGILISANEPSGRFECELSDGVFRVAKSGPQVDELPRQVFGRAMAQLILTSVCAGAGFVESGAEELEPVKIESQWYQPIELAAVQAGWAKQKLYRNRDSSVIDRVLVEDQQRGVFLVGLSYDYRWIEEAGKSIPTQIEVFSINKAGKRQRRILQVKYHTIETF